MNKQLLILCCLLLGWKSNTSAQSYMTSIQTYNVADGLSGRAVNCFYRDTKGFVWIGTNNGLNRFDGTRFTIYTQESHQLSSNTIRQLAEDAEGHLWLLHGSDFGGNTALDVFDPITKTSTSAAKLLNRRLPFSAKNISQLFTFQAKLWIVLLTGEVFLYDNQILERKQELHQEHYAKQLFFYQQDKSWLATKHKLIHFSKQFKATDSISLNLDIDRIVSVDSLNQPYFIARDENAIPQGADSVPVYLYHGSERLAQFPDGYTNLIALDRERKQLCIVSSKEPKVVLANYQGEIIEESNNGIEQQVRQFAFLDKQYWYYFNNEEIALAQTVFTPFQKLLYNRKSIYNINYAVRGMAFLSDQTLAVNGLGYSYLLDIQTGKAQQLGVHLHYYTKTIDPDLTNGLAVLKTKDHLWLTDERVRLAQYDINSKEFKQYKYPDSLQVIYEDVDKPIQGIQPTLQWSLFQDDHKKLWIGTKNGLAYLDSVSGHLKLFDQYNDFPELQASAVYHFHPSKKGIWLATSAGLFLLDTEKGIIDWVHTQGQADKHLPHNYIAHIHEDSLGYFWLASKGGGLIQWHPETKKTVQYTTENGLSDNVIYAVYTDDYGKLWLSSNRGIMRFDKQTHEVSTYLPKDGVSHEEFNTIAHLQAADGSIYFGSLNGITAFHPKDFYLDEENHHQLYITSFMRQSAENGEFTDETEKLLKEKKIVLEPNDLGFALEFSSLNYHQENTQYAYRIVGIDQKWNYLNDAELRVGRLPFGQYQLEIKAQGDLGIWSLPISLHVVLQKPYYLSAWFLFTVGLMLLITVWVIILFRTHQLQKTKNLLEQEVASRTAQIAADKQVIEQQAENLKVLDKIKSRFFANISHELRTPLTLILAPIAHLLQLNTLDQSNRKLLVHAQQNGALLLESVNEILDLSKLEADKLSVHIEAVPVYNFAQQIIQNFQQQAIYKQLVLSSSCDIDPNVILLLDAKKVIRIINNLVANALKFTPKGGTITLSFSQTPTGLKVVVSDTGKGITQEELPHIFERYYQAKHSSDYTEGGTGIGLALSKELADLMKATLTVESQLGKGTSFEFHLPTTSSDNIEVANFEDTLNESLEETTSVLPNPHQLDKPTLLLVEDNPRMQSFLCSLLRDTYNVLLAENGIKAIETLENCLHKPELIISDVMMPEMDGFALLDWLKQHAQWQHVPIIMLTARTAEKDKLHALTTGVDDYLTKPFLPQELFARIKNLLSNYQQRKEWQVQEEDVEEFQLPEVDQLWLAQIEEAILQKMGQHDFSQEAIAATVNLSERQFRRKLKQLTGLTPSKFQLEVQLQQARNYLEIGKFHTVSEVASAVGFQTVKYFSKLFKERFGRNPSDF